MKISLSKYISKLIYSKFQDNFSFCPEKSDFEKRVVISDIVKQIWVVKNKENSLKLTFDKFYENS